MKADFMLVDTDQSCDICGVGFLRAVDVKGLNRFRWENFGNIPCLPASLFKNAAWDDFHESLRRRQVPRIRSKSDDAAVPAREGCRFHAGPCRERALEE